MYKRMLFGKDARVGLFRGIEKVYKAVSMTMGPNGMNVVMDNSFGPPVVTKDGVSVAKGIVLRDKVDDYGARMIIDAAHRTGVDCGDGTTTSTVLAYSMIKDFVESGGSIGIKRGMNSALHVIEKSLKAQVVRIGKDNAWLLKRVASISANNDYELGKVIGEAVEIAGEYGSISVEQSINKVTGLELKSGFNFSGGYLSSSFVTNQRKGIVEYENPVIVIYNDKLVNVNELMGVLEYCVNSLRPLLLIVNDIDNLALNYFVGSRERTGFNICIVRAPGYAYEKEMYLRDLSDITGAIVINDDNKMSLRDGSTDVYGSAEKVVINRDSTSIVMDKRGEEAAAACVETLKGMVIDAEEGYDKNLLERRIANLTSRSVVIKIGAKTDIEMKEKMDRVDDSIHATRNALKSGIVPGGGKAYMVAAINAPLANTVLDNEDEIKGYKNVMDALIVPFITICSNSGIDYTTKIENCMVDNVTGYDARFDNHVNMLEVGIVDPLPVVLSAVQNAVSVAGMVLLTNCVISDDIDFGNDIQGNV